MGYESKDLIGKSAFKFIHPNDRKKLFPLLKKYIEAKRKKILTGNKLEISETLEFRVSSCNFAAKIVISENCP